MSTTDGVSTVDAPAPGPAQHRGAWSRLYRGETRFDFVGHRRWWYMLSGIVILAGLVSFGIRGLNEGIDFKGGTSWEVTAHGATVSQVTTAVQHAGVSPSLVQGLGTGSNAHVQVEADLSAKSATQRQATEAKVAARLAAVTHSPVSSVSISEIGPTWGSQITNKAILAVIVFFVVVVAYISFRFEWKMALAALVAVIHDLLVVAGVYSLSGLQVTPDTVVAVLTILGYSLYDTVVVFDRVADNAKGLGATGRMTYQEVVNLSMNQTLARSINTSLVAILPTLSVLIIGAQVLGATTLQYFGFALVIGLISGAYSSLFIASPILSQLKEREPRYRSIRQKLDSRADRTGLLTPRAAALMVGAGPGAGRSGTPRPTGSRGRSAPRPGAARPPVRPGAGRPGGARRSEDSAASPVLRPGGAGSAAVATDPAAEGSAALVPEGNGSGQRPKAPAARAKTGGTPARRPAAKRKGAKKGGRRR